MKKLLAILALTASMSAQAAPLVYGKINMAIQNNSQGSSTGTTVDSLSSRIGIKGSEDLGGGSKAFYKLEFKIDPNSTTKAIDSRDQFVGLSNKYGFILGGKRNTPLKNAAPYDMFKDSVLDIKNITKIGFGNTKGGQDRLANSMIVGTKFGAVSFEGDMIPNQTSAKGGALDDTYSLSAMYGSYKKGLMVSLAYNASNDSSKGTFIRTAVQYKDKTKSVSYMFQQSDQLGAEGMNHIVAGSYRVQAFEPKVKISFNDELKNSGAKGIVYGAGLNYYLSKNSKLYTEYASFDKDFAGTAYDVYNIGFIHKF